MPFTVEGDGARKEAGRQALMNNSMRQRTKEEEERARRRMGATSAETCMYGTCEQSGKETRRPGYLPVCGHGSVFFSSDIKGDKAYFVSDILPIWDLPT